MGGVGKEPENNSRTKHSINVNHGILYHGSSPATVERGDEEADNPTMSPEEISLLLEASSSSPSRYSDRRGATRGSETIDPPFSRRARRRTTTNGN